MDVADERVPDPAPAAQEPEGALADLIAQLNINLSEEELGEVRSSQDPAIRTFLGFC